MRRTPTQEVGGNSTGKGNECIETDREGTGSRLPHVSGYPGKKREPEEQIHIRPENPGIDFLYKMKEVVMIHPVDCHNQEAQGIAQERRPELCKR